MTNLRIATVNKAVQEIESGWELVKGEGYFYWSHPTDMSYLDCASVAVYKLNHMTLDQWVDQFKNRGPEHGTLAYYQK
tara:strand:- start:61 stop:294 length:234 start_codon:yes stop_codon:yes gene_type:complete